MPNLKLLPMRTADEEVIGNYRIKSVLGEGGMGKVYAAEHRLLGRQVAIKVLLPQYSRHPTIVEQFFKEAWAAAAAKNPGIIEIYDFGYQDSGSAFIAMELLEGEDLESRLRRLGRITQLQALLFTRQIASALAAAHGNGIVHCDLKPANIFIIADPHVAGGERIKILDFGIAKVSMPGLDAASPDQKTREDSVLGTPSYMAPEQCRGTAGVDARSDVYSVGCILFEMLCGRPPFVGATSLDVMSAHLRDTPPAPSALEPALDTEIDALIMALLAKEPDARFQRAVTLERAVRILIYKRCGSASVSSEFEQRVVVPWFRRPSLILTFVLTIGVGGAVIHHLLQTTGERHPMTTIRRVPPGPARAPMPLPPRPRRPPNFYQGLRDGTLPAEVEAARVDEHRTLWRITSEPRGGQVFHGDDVVGTTKTPFFIVMDRDPARAEILTVELFGYVEQHLELIADKDDVRHLELVEQAEVAIRSKPSGAVIYDDKGRARGITPFLMRVPPGERPLAFVLSLEGHADEFIEIMPDENKIVNVTLTPLVLLRIESDPPGVQVWRNGELLGVTPYQDAIPRSREPNLYRLTMKGYEDEEIDMPARRHRTRRVVLRKRAP